MAHGRVQLIFGGCSRAHPPTAAANRNQDIMRLDRPQRPLRNLSVYLAANEEEALNYLFLGDTNRAISETAMNKASSRSHCIFTVRGSLKSVLRT